MNHDENNTNKDNLTTDLEARVVAWVAGESSAFEAAELERLTTDNPEVAVFKRRVQAVQGLVAEAVRPDKDPLRLSPERREKLLQTIDSKDADASKKTKVVVFANNGANRRRKFHRALMAIAACLVLGVFGALLIPSFQKVRVVALRQEKPQAGLMLQMELSPPSETEKHAFEETQAERTKREIVVKSREESLLRENKAKADLAALAKETARGRPARAPVASATNGAVTYGTTMRPAAAPPPGAPATWGDSTRGFSDGAGTRISLDGASASQSSGPVVVGGSYGESRKAEAAKPTDLAALDFKSKRQAGDTVTLSTFAVAGSRYKNPVEIAVNEERSAQNIKKIVGADLFGPISEANVGEVVKQLPGISAGLEKGYASVGKDAELAQGKFISLGDADLPLPKPQQIVSGKKEVEVIAAKEPVSTFSLHVSDVSFQLAREVLAKGSQLDRERIRPEEFYNAFSYGDPAPTLTEKISCRVEQAAHPLIQQRNLVRVAMKVAAAGRGAGQPLHLTVLLDTSGSMEREDRLQTVHAAMKALVSQLGSNDEITLIGFARQPRLIAESIRGDEAGKLLDMIANTPAEGGTNLEEAIKLGSELGRRHFQAGAQNRIVLITDGAANLGDANRAHLAAAIDQLRQEGIALDACGVGMDGLDDAMLESLTRKSDGRYYVLNSAEDADAKFVHQLAGALRPAAKNVKLQVRFNPSRVRSYRLIGFEQYRLREEDFRNDKVDAAELAAEESAVAVYQVEPLTQGEGDLGEVFVRFLDAASGQMVERSWPLPYDAKAPVFDRASSTMQLAGVSALFAEVLERGGEEDRARLMELAPVVRGLRSRFPGNQRVGDLVDMFEKLKKETSP